MNSIIKNYNLYFHQEFKKKKKNFTLKLNYFISLKK